jgi:hypothetical protein
MGLTPTPNCFAKGAPGAIAAALLALGLAGSASAQTFDSTSDGSDGALVLNRPDPDPNPNQEFVIEFDPDNFNPPLDPDRDNVYHFTTITIGQDVTVRLSAKRLNGPVYWIAQSVVSLEGILNLDGEPGDDTVGDLNNLMRLPAFGGAGGFSGGVGSLSGVPGTPGLGPGGGRARNPPGGGAGGGHASAGQGFYFGTCDQRSGGGPAYGNEFLVPLQGGSGGAGGSGRRQGTGSGGGGGGGAILIASSATVEVDGQILARGGRGGHGDLEGGGGSGGAIRIVAPTIRGTGMLVASGGAAGASEGSNCSDGGNGAPGRIRLEAFDHQFTGTTNPVAPRRAPIDVFLPAQADRALSSLRVVSVDGVALENPTASITSADVTTETRDPIEVAVEARNIPLGTVVNLRVISENAADQVLDSTPLAGTRALSTATVTIPSLPPGFSRAFVRAEWSEE